MKPIFIPVFILLLVSCKEKKVQEDSGSPAPEAISFAGTPLFSKPAEPAALAKSDSVISAITSKGELTEDDFVEIGKQLVGTARYKMATENYTTGLAKYPNSYKLLRNRGHRYITLRQLDNSIKDLTKAEELIRTEPDVMEYGLDGKPTATVRHQIWYHIGVYHFLNNQDYSQSAAAFEKALATAGDSKNVVGSSDWLYTCYMRLGQKEKATALLTAIPPDMDTDREQAYFRRIMLYKGVIKPEELMDVKMAPDKMSVQEVTKMYGLANWYRDNGDSETAAMLYKTILQSDAWPGFAYAASEKEVLK